MTRPLRPDGTIVIPAEEIDRRAQDHVEGRFIPKERHGRLYEPAKATEPEDAPLSLSGGA